MKGFIKDEIPSRWDGNQMTHDELLQKIDYYFDTDNFHIHKNALRAVVELHKPQEIRLLSGEIEMTYCYECDGIDYPCPTIQAIEKELK